MLVNKMVACKDFPCSDVSHDRYAVPDIEIAPERVSIVMISEAAPADPADRYYAGGGSLFEKTTVQAFNDAGVDFATMQDIVDSGVYLTTAVKCGKTAYGIETGTVKQCSSVLEKELALFPDVRVIMLMGEVAIKALNEIARRAGEARVIPAGSTYKIRGQEFRFRGARVLPSYLQAGPSFFIEKSKRRMIAQDIAQAVQIARAGR
jgi:uracil-DNA glycosylase